MKRQQNLPWLIAINLFVLMAAALFSMIYSKTADAYAEKVDFLAHKMVVIDPGHGGVDTGATSCTGVAESHINLQIALKLEDLFHLLGVPTYMIRTTDRSIHTQGNTIAAQKVSDLKNRVQIIDESSNAIFISIHQNYFSSSKYAGAQCFYGNSSSAELAAKLQETIRQTINPGNKRLVKKAEGIYLLEHVKRTGVLLECGFLSNPEEETKLRNNHYQSKLCSVIAVTYTNYLNQNTIS